MTRELVGCQALASADYISLITLKIKVHFIKGCITEAWEMLFSGIQFTNTTTGHKMPLRPQVGDE